MGLKDGSELSSEGIVTLIQQLGGTMKRNPSPMKLLESYYFGEQSLLAARETIKVAESN